MIKNIFGILLISLSLSIMGYFYLSTEKKPLNPFQNYLLKEVDKKLKAHELPKEWHQIKNVKYKYQSEKSNQLLGELPFIKVNPKGMYRLDITFIDEPDSSRFILIQFNLINLNTNNLAYEFFLRVDLDQIK